MSDTVSITGLAPAAVLAALYNASKPQGMGFLSYDPAPMTEDEAAALLTGPRPYFDYLKGRVMKIEVSGDQIDARLYDRDNGHGAAAQAIDALRSTGTADNIHTQSSHAAGTRERLAQAEAMAGEPEMVENTGGKFPHFTLQGLPKEVLPHLERARAAIKSPLDV